MEAVLTGFFLGGIDTAFADVNPLLEEGFEFLVAVVKGEQLYIIVSHLIFNKLF